MNYEIILPDTVWRDDAVRPFIGRDLLLPALACLYGKGRKSKLAESAVLAYLSSTVAGVACAVAPLGLVRDLNAAEPGFWLRADPIHLRIDRDRLTVLGSSFFQISQTEADALVAALNQLFSADGYTFVAITPTRWYLRLPTDPQLQFCSLHQALGNNLQDCLPQGEGALRFHALINEMQMVLYGHAVNDARDAVGAPMINSVFLWGGGQYPAAQALPDFAMPVYGGDDLVAALVGPAWQPAPSCAHELAEHDAVIVLDHLSFDAIYGQAYEWRQQWLQLEQDWFAPLLAQLKAGKIQQLTLTFPSANEQIKLSRMDLYRFWQSPRLPF